MYFLTFVAAMIFLIGCQPQQQTVNVEDTSATPIPSFTYVAYGGAIWQVDINGNKKQLLPDDGVEKWKLRWSPNRQWLAYVQREWPESDTETPSVVQESLIVIDADMVNSRLLAGPIRAIQIKKWVDEQTIEVWLTDWVTDGSRRQEWDKFLLDVETGVLTEIEQEAWSPIPPPVFSPDDQWTFAFEKQGGRNRVYLVDHNGHKIHQVYERPADQSLPLRWSPDSQHLLYYSRLENEDVYVYDLTTQKSLNVTNFPKGQGNHSVISLVSWSPTGEWIFLRRETDKLSDEPCVIHIAPNQVYCFEVRALSGQFVWSVDGRYLGFVVITDNEQRDVDLYAIDAVSGKLLNLTQNGSSVIESEIEEGY